MFYFYLQKAQEFKKTLITINFLLIILLLLSGCDNEKGSSVKPTSSSSAAGHTGQSDYKCDDCNLILISIDTLRADHLSSYGYQRETSPNVDRFFKDGILFKFPLSPSSLTAPSHMSLMTGLYPSDHRVCNWEWEKDECNSPLPPSIPTMAQVLKNNGYKTYAFTGGANVSGELGFKNGFIEYHHADDAIEDLDLLFSDPMQLKKYTEGGKFFIFFHSFKVHDPYFPQDDIINKFCSSENDRIAHSWKTLNRIIQKKLVESPDSDFAEKYFKVLRKKINKSYQDQKLFNEIKRLTDGEFSAESIKSIAAELENLEQILEHDDEYIHYPLKFMRTFTFPESQSKEFAEDLDYINCLYDSEIFEMDHTFGKLFRFLEESGLSKNTIVIFTSDHGEEFYEHEGFIHHNLYNEILHVPFLIKNPKLENESIVINKKVATINLLPTVLDMLDIDLTIQVRGESLMPLVYNASHVENTIFSELMPTKKSLILEDYKLITSPRPKYIIYPPFYKLYNIEKDFYEQDNIFMQQPWTGIKLGYLMWKDFNKLEKIEGQNIEEQTIDSQKPDEETLERLKALGYVN